MAASVQGERKHRPSLSIKEGHSSSSPESSLSWCLAHLNKPKTKTDSGTGKDTEKRSRAAQWKALVAIRTHHIKGDRSAISRFRHKGGLRPLLDLIKHPECNRKTLDLALSILGNCCTEMETRVEVRKLNGINIVVDIMKRNVAVVTVQNRAARALANLAMDPESSALIHSAGGVPLLLLCVSLSSAPSSPTSATPTDSCPKLECAQSAARALLYLSDTPSNRLLLVTQGALSALAPLIAPEYPEALRRAALRTLHELTRGCGVECAREVSRSGVLSQLGVMASGEAGKPFEELALKTLANVCSQGCLRPLVGSLDVIPKFTDEVKRDPLKSGVFLKALCLCCKEAVNRAKVKDSGGLEVLMSFLAAHQSHPLSRLAILACVDFVFDESAMEQLQELGLVPLLVARLVKVTKGEEQAAEKMDTSLTSHLLPTELLPSTCFDSFDFPAPEAYKKEQGLCSSSFLSLRSWLLSEGLISSEGDLLDSSSTIDAEWGGLQLPLPQTPNTTNSVAPQKRLSPVTSSTPLPPPLLKIPDPSSSPQTSSISPPQSSSSSSVSSPNKTPVSPTKFCSPHKRKQREKASVLAKFTLETPPSVPRPTAYHPYHPEPWTPESPILLLLSRFSHVSDPSAALVTTFVMSGLVHYLSNHPDPSSRCFRMLCRLSCNPNCLQALVRSGSVALIRHHLCQREKGAEQQERQSARVRAKVKQLGFTLLSNLRVQCESGFGSGVLSHVVLSGPESDKMNAALSLPLISSNKPLLKKLLLDSGGLMLALQPLGDDKNDKDQSTESEKLHTSNSPLHSLYFPLLIGCLSALVSGLKTSDKTHFTAVKPDVDKASPPPFKKPRLADACPYSGSDYDLLLQLDDGTKIPANRGAVSENEAGSEYFRALLKGGFEEAQGRTEDAIPIKDVSAGMLIPVLHYLHGCRFKTRRNNEESGKCQVLDSVVMTEIRQTDTEEFEFQKMPLGELMVGAFRFLVSELQRDLEEVCVSLLTSAAALHDVEKAETAEEILANRTSELELNVEMQTEHKHKSPLTKNGIQKTIALSCSDKNGIQRKLKTSAFGGLISTLLPQMYWFSQRYSYPQLGRTCLSSLLGPALSPSVAGECLRRLAKKADCTDSLKRDLVGLATTALS